MISLDRSDWPAVLAAFTAFFESLGTVKTDGETASFAAPESGTGLVLGRNGTSTSFMPLHGLTGSWDEVTFDREGRTVTVSGEGFAYTYRVPPGLGDG